MSILYAELLFALIFIVYNKVSYSGELQNGFVRFALAQPEKIIYI